MWLKLTQQNAKNPLFLLFKDHCTDLIFLLYIFTNYILQATSYHGYLQLYTTSNTSKQIQMLKFAIQMLQFQVNIVVATQVLLT